MREGSMRMASSSTPRLMASVQEPAKMMRVIFTPCTSIRPNSGFDRMAMMSKPFITGPSAGRACGGGGSVRARCGEATGHLQGRGDLHMADIHRHRRRDREGD